MTTDIVKFYCDSWDAPDGFSVPSIAKSLGVPEVILIDIWQWDYELLEEVHNYI